MCMYIYTYIYISPRSLCPACYLMVCWVLLCSALWKCGSCLELESVAGATAMMLREAPFCAGLFFLRDRMALFFHGQGGAIEHGGGSDPITGSSKPDVGHGEHGQLDRNRLHIESIGLKTIYIVTSAMSMISHLQRS